MSKLKLFLALAAILAATGTLRAQNDAVNLIELEGRMAIFSVETESAKEKGVTTEALLTLFRTLIDEGVSGIEGGTPLMQIRNDKWRENFLKQGNPPYMLYVKGIQTEGAPIKNSVGKFKATVLVKVNMDLLFKQLKNYGVMRK